MKIKHLWVSKYKNVEDINLNFNSELITLLVGKNGLGKSNLIEILALIFRDLDLIQNEETFENWAYENFQFSINYECFLDEIIIELKEYVKKGKKGSKELKFTIFTRPKNAEKIHPFVELEFDAFKKIKNKLLPEFIIGYYSGENKRIKKIINEHEEVEKKRLLDLANKKNNNAFDEGTRRLFFTENFHSQVVLLTMQLYCNNKDYKKLFSKLLIEYLNIEDIPEFSIKFNNPSWNYSNLGNEKINKGMDYMIANIQDKVDNPFWNMAGKLDRLLTRFYNYEIDKGKEPKHYPIDKEIEREYEKEILEFSNIDIRDFSEELKDIFVRPVTFFDALETINFLGALKEIKFKVKKIDLPDLIEYADLSEGEQQLLTVIGLVLLFGKNETLFLFDEPDTHLNPDWQRDYVSLLRDFNLNDENSHIFVATHSPLIVQAGDKADIILFHKNEDGKIEVDENNFKIHNWRIDHVLMSKYFGLKSTRPPEVDTIMNKRLEIIRKGSISKADLIILKKYEKDIGSLPTGETIEELESMLYIKEMSKKINNDKGK